jgi:5'-deoxynucleotidase YfbR-like HD superfamily hydrolase
MRAPFIETRTGRRFQPLNPIIKDIDIEDIAHSLANQCRFTGHTAEHYSVAEHSVRVWQLVGQWGLTKPEQRWALLHDASEAYLVDIPSPLKCTPVFALYREAEARLMRAICVRYTLSCTQPLIVHRADAVLLATEVRDLMPGREEHWGALAEKAIPRPYQIVPWSPTTAKRRFLAAFEQVKAEAA